MSKKLITLLFILAIFGVFIFPAWFELSYIVLLALFVKPRHFWVIPALVYDTAYYPGGHFKLRYAIVTFITLFLVLIYWFIRNKTRFHQVYDFSKKEN